MPGLSARILRRALLLITLLALLSSFPLTITARAQAPSTLRIGMAPPTTLDPVQLSRFDPSARDLVENLFVGLTRFNPETHTIEPMLAKEWTVSADGLTWTFTLRDDVQWVRYDAATQSVIAVRPIAAGDFVYAIQRACDPTRPSPVTTNLKIVEGCLTIANAFPEVITDLLVAREIGAVATGPNTLEITLLFPAAYFPSLLSTPEFRPLPRETINAAENWTDAATIITNGPYAMQASSPAGVALVQNPYWPEPVTGNVARIDVMYSAETAALVAGGGADIARLSSDQISIARSLNLGNLMTINEGTTLTMLGFSLDRSMVELAEIRRALSLAIDREALVQQFFPDTALPVTQFTPDGVASAPNVTNALYNPTQALSFFEMAGFANCAGVPEKVILLVPEDDPVWAEAGLWITQQWAATFGCNSALFEVKPVARTLLVEIAHANYDPTKVTRSHIWLATWTPDYPDANDWLYGALHCHFGYLRLGRSCDGSDENLDAATLEPDPARRADYYAQVEEQLFGTNGTYPVAPLMISVTAWLQQPQITQANSAGAARYDLWIIASDN